MKRKKHKKINKTHTHTKKDICEEDWFDDGLIWWRCDLMMVWLIVSVLVCFCLFVCVFHFTPASAQEFCSLVALHMTRQSLAWLGFPPHCASSLLSLLTALPPHWALSSLRSLLTASLLTELPPHCNHSSQRSLFSCGSSHAASAVRAYLYLG